MSVAIICGHEGSGKTMHLQDMIDTLRKGVSWYDFVVVTASNSFIKFTKKRRGKTFELHSKKTTSLLHDNRIVTYALDTNMFDECPEACIAVIDTVIKAIKRPGWRGVVVLDDFWNFYTFGNNPVFFNKIKELVDCTNNGRAHLFFVVQNIFEDMELFGITGEFLEKRARHIYIEREPVKNIFMEWSSKLIGDLRISNDSIVSIQNI